MRASVRISPIVIGLTCAALAACGDSAEQADAAIDSPPLPPGNFDCVGTSWPTNVRDPFPIAGEVDDWNGAAIGGASVEVHDVETDALLGQTTSSTGGGLVPVGRWGVSIPTGGTARKIYRKMSLAPYIDTYAYDAFPEFQEFRWGAPLLTVAERDALYTAADMTPDPSAGVLSMEAWDCYPPGTTQITGTVGATFEGPPGSKVIYWNAEGAADPMLTSTLAPFFGAAIVGVPPGLVEVRVTAGPLTYRTWPVEVRANAITVSPRHP